MEWISINRLLPRIDVEVLATREHINPYTGNWWRYVDVASYSDGEWESSIDMEYNKDKVVAWQNLPRAYTRE